MNIQKITKIALLTALVALTGSQCWGAAGYPNRAKEVLSAELPSTLIDSIAQFIKDKPQTLIEMARANPELAPFVENILFRPLLEQFGNNPQKAFWYAVQNNMLWALNYLMFHGANANATDPDGDTALNIAALAGDEAAVRALLDVGAFVDHTNYRGETPLMSAIDGMPESGRGSKSNFNIIEMLLNAGALVNLKNNNDGTTAYDRALCYQYHATFTGDYTAINLIELLRNHDAFSSNELGG